MLLKMIFLVLVTFGNAFRLPVQVATAVTNITQGGQTLEQESNFFVAKLTIGTPGQLFTVIIDTKTSDLVVPDKTCTTENNCYNKKKFDSSASSSYYGYSLQYTFKNNAGTFQGFAGKDTVVIGDRKTDLITIPNVKFLQSKTIGLMMNGLGADGVLGLSSSQATQIAGNSPFVQGVLEGDISASFFSIWLEHIDQTSDMGTHGVIYYGGLDHVHCAPSPDYVPTTNSKYYQITTSNVQSIGSVKTTTNSKYIQTIIDTTTGQILVPSAYISNILDSIGVASTNVYPPFVPCDITLTLTFTFAGGVTANVTERDLVTSYFERCKLQIVPSYDGMITLGIPFLRGRCTYFDPIRSKIGLTPALL